MSQKRQDKRTVKIVALGGILLALTTVTVFLAGFIPALELTLYAVSSFYIAVMIIETSVKGGWTLYLASSILLLILIPNKIVIVPYVFFFGIYGIIKRYIENIRKQVIEILLKLIFFNISLGLVYRLFKDVLIEDLNMIDLPAAVLIIGLQIMFLLYDYIYTLFIGFYRNRFPIT